MWLESAPRKGSPKKAHLSQGGGQEVVVDRIECSRQAEEDQEEEGDEALAGESASVTDRRARTARTGESQADCAAGKR